MSEGVIADMSLGATASYNVTRSDTTDMSNTQNGLLDIVESISEIMFPQDTQNASADLVGAVNESSRNFEFYGILGQYVVRTFEYADGEETLGGNTSSNVGVQEATNLDAEETRRLLWENIDDSQSPGWQPIDTN